MFKILNPIDGEQVLEGRMIGWVGYVRERVVRQELVGLRKLRSLGVQVLLEFRLRLSELLIVVLHLEVLQILDNVWVLAVDDEVYLEVELQLFVLEILLLHLSWNELIK